MANYGKFYCITYVNADDDSFAERTHVRKMREAIKTAKTKILLEHLEYGRDLNAKITDDHKPTKKPYVITLKDLIDKVNGLSK